MNNSAGSSGPPNKRLKQSLLSFFTPQGDAIPQSTSSSAPLPQSTSSSAPPERSFSCLRRLKTYLRSTMGQERLNHLLMLNIHQDKADVVDMRSIARDFVSLHQTRRDMFGLF